MHATYTTRHLNAHRFTHELIGKSVTVTDGGGNDLTGTVEAVNVVDENVARVKIGDDWYDNFRPAQ
jgi:hypothetical protein